MDDDNLSFSNPERFSKKRRLLQINSNREKNQMLDFPINFRRYNRHVINLLCAGTLTFSCMNPLYSFEYADGLGSVPTHYESEWFLRYFNSIDENTEIGEVIDFMVSFKASLEAKGCDCPSLVDILFNTKAYVESQGIEVDEEAFEEIHNEIIRREIPSSGKTFTNLVLKNQRPHIELVKKHKHKHKDKDKKEVKMKSKGVFGFLKCIAGALIFIVPIPGAQAVGSGLVLLGINDMVDSAHEQGEENERLQRLDEQRRNEAQQLGISP